MVEEYRDAGVMGGDEAAGMEGAGSIEVEVEVDVSCVLRFQIAAEGERQGKGRVCLIPFSIHFLEFSIPFFLEFPFLFLPLFVVAPKIISFPFSLGYILFPNNRPKLEEIHIFSKAKVARLEHLCGSYNSPPNRVSGRENI
jgi:hypothetical protein